MRAARDLEERIAERASTVGRRHPATAANRELLEIGDWPVAAGRR